MTTSQHSPTIAPLSTAPSPPKPIRWIAASALWAFAEATVFFVVPDVILTAVAVRCGWRTGLIAALAASIAAALGGIVVYLVTAGGTDTLALFEKLPAISTYMVAEVRAAMEDANWPWAMLDGSFSGIPYKLYAASAAEAGVPILALALWSVPVRLVRFVLLAGLAALARPLLLRWLGPRLAMLPLAALWIAFYAVFWLRMPS